MRRALAGIVPKDVLERKRKAFVARSHMAAFSNESRSLLALTENMLTATGGIVNPVALREAICRVRHGQEVPLISIMRVLLLEYWLRCAAGEERMRLANVSPHPFGLEPTHADTYEWR
jgi:asparagine synthase (glutamine-hydrolysing)